MKYGYRLGDLEKETLKLFLNIKQKELPRKYNESFSDIFKTARQKNEYREVINRLNKKGFIHFVNKGGEIKTVISNKGRQVADNLFLNDYLIKKPAEWDGKWRMVMFDIPESKRKYRNIIRFHLKKIGFLQIQGSVWIYPYPCEEIVSIIKNNFKFNDEVIYVTSGSFERDSKFKKMFNL